MCKGVIFDGLAYNILGCLIPLRLCGWPLFVFLVLAHIRENYRCWTIDIRFRVQVVGLLYMLDVSRSFRHLVIVLLCPVFRGSWQLICALLLDCLLMCGSSALTTKLLWLLYSLLCGATQCVYKHLVIWLYSFWRVIYINILVDDFFFHSFLQKFFGGMENLAILKIRYSDWNTWFLVFYGWGPVCLVLRSA